MTPELLQDALVADLKALFTHHTLKSSTGVERAVNVYPDDTPIREGDDDGENREAPPEPYVLVKTMGGNIQEETGPHMVEIILVACVYDRSQDRQGRRDAMHLVNEILYHYATNGIVARRYALQYPIRWAMPDDDTHPYYYAAMALSFEAPAATKEVPEL